MQHRKSFGLGKTGKNLKQTNINGQKFKIKAHNVHVIKTVINTMLVLLIDT